jgi:hypothetical protein
VYTFETGSVASEVLERDCWGDGMLAEKLKQAAVAVRLAVGTTEHGQFSQLYPASAQQPCVFFVSPRGELLATLSGDEISTAAVLHTLQVSHAKSKIEALRVQRETAEEAAKQTSEIRRREEAKQLQDSKRQMEERRVAAEGARAKEAAEASRRHRDEVVAKVRLEREERSNKLHNSGEGMVVGVPPLSASPPATAARVPSDPGRAKIKFVIGDKTISHTFSSRDTLGALRAFLRAEGYSGFTLETVFPRRTLTAEQDGRTLESLSLTPACAIVVSLSPGATMRGVGGVLSAAPAAPQAGPTVGPLPGNFFGGRAEAAPAGGRTTQHPNLDPTYVHPEDNNTFVNSIAATVSWLYNRATSCCRQRPTIGAASPGPSASVAAAAQRRSPPPRTRPGGYEELAQNEK